jgi:hypothetical protein
MKTSRPIVDAETNKLVAIFDNDRDPQAEAKTLQYIASGELPDENAAPGQADDEPAPEPDSDRPESGTADVQQRLDDLVERQRELLRETEALRDALERERGAGQPELGAASAVHASAGACRPKQQSVWPLRAAPSASKGQRGAGRRAEHAAAARSSWARATSDRMGRMPWRAQPRPRSIGVNAGPLPPARQDAGLPH